MFQSGHAPLIEVELPLFRPKERGVRPAMNTHRLNRRAFLAGAGAAALGLRALARDLAAGDGRKRPIILFILADDHATAAVGAYGSMFGPTPSIDRLAAEGMRFDNCFCTNAICSPSRAVTLTGLHSHVNRVTTNMSPFDGGQTTFPELLRGAGYETALVGKWHLDGPPRGFDHFEVLDDLNGQGHYYNPTFRTGQGTAVRRGYVTDIITDLCVDWLKEGRDREKPFLLLCHHKAAHRPWMPALDDLGLYRDVELPEPPNLFDDYRNRAGGAGAHRFTVEKNAFGLTDAFDLKLPAAPGDRSAKRWQTYFERMTDEQKARWRSAYDPGNKAFTEAGLKGRDLVRWRYQRYVKDYLRTAASLDRGVGRLLDHLAGSGLDTDTVVVYCSDQGIFLGEHGWIGKQWMYEESLRVPLIVRWPGRVEPGSVNTDLAQNLDFAPTLLDIAGIALPGAMQGCSLVPLLEDSRPADWRSAIYYQFFGRHGRSAPAHYGLRTARHKLIYYYNDDAWELFDLQADPGEMNSVHDNADYAETIAGLKKELKALRQLYGAEKHGKNF